MDNRNFARLSTSIEYLRFPLVLSIIFLHCYTSTKSLTAGYPGYFRTVYPFALWIGETGVPAYFFISGMLFFYSSKTYSQKLLSRVRTLLIPYLFINGIILFALVALALSGRSVLILDKDIADYTFIDFLRVFWDRGSWESGNGAPLLCPFWYLRNLMVLVVCSPILYYILKYAKMLFPLVAGFFWINSHDSAYTLQSLTLFSLGAYFPINNKDPLLIFDNFKYIFISLFFVLGIVDILHCYVSVPYALQIHRLSLTTNIFFLLWIGVYFSNCGLYSSYLSKSAFFVFCVHYPLTLGLRMTCQLMNVSSEIVYIAFYCCSVVVVACICVLLYSILNKIMPKFLNVITGNRS